MGHRINTYVREGKTFPVFHVVGALGSNLRCISSNFVLFDGSINISHLEVHNRVVNGGMRLPKLSTVGTFLGKKSVH